MYAAAGGASLASRQARQRQRENKKKQQQQQQQKAQKADPFGKHQPQPKQFHNYTDDSSTVGVVPPSSVAPKLSRVERGALKPPTVAQQHERRHSTSNYHLKEAATNKSRIRESPSISIPVVPNQLTTQPLTPCTLVQQQNHLPVHSTTSLHHHHHHQQQQHHQPHHHRESQHELQLQQQLPQIFIPPETDGNKLERRCSFVRQVEEMEKCQEGGLLDRCNHICNFEIKDNLWENDVGGTTYFADDDVFGSLDYPFSECSQGRAAWQERERGRRCSISEEARHHRIKQTEAHHRWMKRNRIHDSTYGGGSDEDDFFSVYHQSAAANALLYVGLGTTAIGSVIFFVGTGEKGFKTLELRLIGPTLVACGLLCCLIRVLLCACPSTCLRRRTNNKKNRLKDTCPHSNSSRYPLTTKYRQQQHQDGGGGGGGGGGGDDIEDDDKFHQDGDFVTTTLLNKQNSKKKVSIVPPNHSMPSTSSTTTTNNTTTKPIVFLENEKSSSSALSGGGGGGVAPSVRKLSVPQINLPTNDLSSDTTEKSMVRDDSIIELQNFDLVYDIQSISSIEDDVSIVDDLMEQQQQQQQDSNNRKSSKLCRQREPANNFNKSNDNNIETSLSVVIERNDNSDSSDCVTTIIDKNKDNNTNNDCSSSSGDNNNKNAHHSGIVLSPLQLEQ